MATRLDDKSFFFVRRADRCIRILGNVSNDVLVITGKLIFKYSVLRLGRAVRGTENRIRCGSREHDRHREGIDMKPLNRAFGHPSHWADTEIGTNERHLL